MDDTAPAITVLRLEAEHVVRLLGQIRDGLAARAGEFADPVRYQWASNFLASAHSMAQLFEDEVDNAHKMLPPSVRAYIHEVQNEPALPAGLTDADRDEPDGAPDGRTTYHVRLRGNA